MVWPKHMPAFRPSLSWLQPYVHLSIVMHDITSIAPKSLVPVTGVNEDAGKAVYKSHEAE